VGNRHEAINGLGASEIPIIGEVARLAGFWEVSHQDPFDRLLAAQAVRAGLVLASNDPAFSLFEGVEQLS
jgi:PIN domain nuclease of toxin-antitoxin system